MDLVISAAHDGPHLAMDAVMGVGRQHTLADEEQLVHHEERQRLWCSLHYPIYRIECIRCKI